ncbi:hypothetical protein [Xanthomonas cannabis]|uniref:hypothetical protein n=1 Tax=Xanthomonas cannabis TaxID=1885674 RepID=UPI0011126F8D|nr:hypothetical protein [Xanthomonas cannabis]
MHKLLFPFLFLICGQASATVITNVDASAFELAINPSVNYKNGVCTVQGALIVSNELVTDAHIVIRADRGTSPVAETKTDQSGIYTTSFAAKKGSTFQEVVISKPDKQGKISAVPGPSFVCGVK